MLIISISNFLHLDGWLLSDRLKLLKNYLPLDGPVSKIWLSINKVIDPLHLKNHTRPECEQTYNPAMLTEKFPEATLMVCEQTFSWLSKFKKIVNSMLDLGMISTAG